MNQATGQPLLFLPVESAAASAERAFVAIVRTREEFLRQLEQPAPGLQWLQVEGLLDDPEPWAAAAQGEGAVSLDVVITDPETEFAHLYRLVDVRATRDVRVTIPAAPGLLKAVRLAAALGLPVRILPGQPSEEMLTQLDQVAAFYLHAPMVQAPVEPFHSLLVTMRGTADENLWVILEEDPSIFSQHDTSGRATLPRSGEPAAPDFVRDHLARLLGQGAECAACPWQQPCAGYFKWPDRDYSCTGIKALFSHLHTAAAEIGEELALFESKAP